MWSSILKKFNLTLTTTLYSYNFPHMWCRWQKAQSNIWILVRHAYFNKLDLKKIWRHILLLWNHIKSFINVILSKNRWHMIYIKHLIACTVIVFTRMYHKLGWTLGTYIYCLKWILTLKNPTWSRFSWTRLWICKYSLKQLNQNKKKSKLDI